MTKLKVESAVSYDRLFSNDPIYPYTVGYIVPLHTDEFSVVVYNRRDGNVDTKRTIESSHEEALIWATKTFNEMRG